MTTDCKSTVINMRMIQSFEVVSGLFDVHRVRAVVTNVNMCGSVRLGICAVGK